MTSLYATIAPHFTQELLSPGLQVGYVDEGGVWQFLAPSLALRLPLRAIEWKNLVGVTQTIDRLPLHFVNEPSGAGTAMPLVCMYVIKCEDMERYKATVKAQIAQWIDRMNAARVDWMLLYVPLGTRAKRGSVSGGMGASGGASSIYKKIFERIKTDFGNKKNASVSGGMGGSGSTGSGAAGGASGGSGISTNDSGRSSGVSMAGLSNLGSSLAGTIGGGGGSNGVSVDRICKIDTLEGASVVGTQATNETQWTELLLKMRKCIMEAFQSKCLQYEEEVRVLDAKRSLPSWDFGAFFVAKERLALMYQQTCLLDDAIRHLDELDAIFQFLVENDKHFQTTAETRPAVTTADAIFSVSALAVDMSAMHEKIASGQAPTLLMRLYFFTRQIRTLYLKGDFRQLIQRATAFISSFHSLLICEQEKSRGEIEWFQPHLWAVGACLEIAYACELSWSGHDYQISSASIPEGVSFALTPEVMACLLGDILYLARRVLKMSARANGWWVMAPREHQVGTDATEAPPLEDRSNSTSLASSQPSDSSWYRTLQNMFESDTPEQFQRCVWELSHLASLHFSRAGRHRFAVFLGSECARYHFRHHEFESASRLFRSHARQCEEDKWWSLMSESVRRICDSELALGRSAQAVAACFSMLEIAQASRAEVSRAYLDQLLTSLVQSLDQSEDRTAEDGDDGALSAPRVPTRVKMGELIKPAMTIETMQSPESDLDYGDVRVTLSLTNQFPAGIHIECVRIRFVRCADTESTDGLDETSVMTEVSLADESSSTAVSHQDEASSSGHVETDSLVDLQEHNVYLYERASVNLIFLYGDVDVGRYKCTGLDCTVAGNSFPLFSRHELDSIRFTIPPRKSTLELHIHGPPLLTPASMEEVHITINSADDVVRQGVLEIALPDDCSLVSISHALFHGGQDKPPTDQQELVKKLTMDVSDLSAKTSMTCSVWLVVSDDAIVVDAQSQDEDADGAGPPSPLVVVLAASLRYDTGTTTAKRHTELRRSERVFQVARPLIGSVRLKRVDATRVFAAIALTCNTECGVRIRDYALDFGSPIDAIGTETEQLNHEHEDDAAEPRVRVVQDSNEHLRGHRLGRSETLHMVFGLQLDAASDTSRALPDHATLRVGVEFDQVDEDAAARQWRRTCLLELALAPVYGAAYQIDVRPKAAPAATSGSWSAGEEVVFAVRVARVDADAPEEPLLLCLAPASDADWILLGKQHEAFRGGGFATTKRLLPLRVGRVPFPQFALRRAAAEELPAARVVCAQQARALLVV